MICSSTFRRFSIKQNWHFLVNIPLLVFAFLVAGTAGAQSDSDALNEQEAAGEMEEVTITGSRREGVSVTEALAPLDVIGGSSIAYQGAIDFTRH
jgi:hypothetical protein